jgi:hypothetical protein
VLGILATTVYNPLSAAMKENAERIESELLAARAAAIGWSQEKAPGNIWVRQRNDDGQAIINAQTASNQGRLLTGVRIFSLRQSRRIPGTHRSQKRRTRNRRMEADRCADFLAESRTALLRDASHPDFADARSGARHLLERRRALVLGTAGAQSNSCAPPGFRLRVTKSSISCCLRGRSCSQPWC